jgi:hypothetical protein
VHSKPARITTNIHGLINSHIQITTTIKPMPMAAINHQDHHIIHASREIPNPNQSPIQPNQPSTTRELPKSAANPTVLQGEE